MRRGGAKTLNEAVQEVIRLECINHVVHKRNVHVSAPINLDKGLLPQVADLPKSIQTLVEGIAGLKVSQEQNFTTMKSSLSEHENHLHQLEVANNCHAKQYSFGCQDVPTLPNVSEIVRRGNWLYLTLVTVLC